MGDVQDPADPPVADPLEPVLTEEPPQLLLQPPLVLETFYTPIYIVSAVFGAIFIIGPCFVRSCASKGIIRCCIMLTAFCMWLFWLIVYISQMNPLVGPKLHNHTVAWIAHKWGVKLLLPPADELTTTSADDIPSPTDEVSPSLD